MEMNIALNIFQDFVLIFDDTLTRKEGVYLVRAKLITHNHIFLKEESDVI